MSDCMCDQAIVLEQMTAGASQLGVDNVEYRRCQTVGCQFYAIQQHNWKCSGCYVNESTGSQSASSTAGHVQQATPHTTTVEEHEPRWSGRLLAYTTSALLLLLTQ